jgi:DNA-binding CsgD family transcriptional regulator
VGACAALAAARAGDQGSAERLLAAVVPALERMAPTMHHHTFAVHYSAVAAWELGAAHRAASLRRLVRGLVGAGAGDSLIASHSLCLARMSALTGDLARAAREFDQARRDLDASGHRPLRAIADHDEARMLVRGGSPDAARVGALLAEALGAFRSLGMAGWERRAAALRASTGPAPTGRPPGGLTPREVEVLQLISAGRTTRQIAEAMIVSRATVERHITSLYRKIGARAARTPPPTRCATAWPSGAERGVPLTVRRRRSRRSRDGGRRRPVEDGRHDQATRRHAMRQRQLERAALDGVELDHEARGSGEAVVLIHAGSAPTGSRA